MFDRWSALCPRRGTVLAFAVYLALWLGGPPGVNGQNSLGAVSSIPTAQSAQAALAPDSAAVLDRELRSEPAATQIKSGLGFFAQQKWSEAEAEFRRALQTDPTSNSAQLWLGYTLFRAGRYADAETIFRQLVSKNPSSANRHGNLGEALLEQKKWADAERSYSRAAELEPTHPLWQYYLGFTVFALKRVEEAENYLRRAVELEPRNPVWYADFAASQSELGKWKNAEAAYRHAIYLNDQPQWHSGLSEALFHQGKTEAAVAELQSAIDRAPQVALFHINLGSLYTKMEKWPEAERALRAGIALKGDQAGWHALLATAYYQQQNYRAAASSYNEAIRLRPNDALSHFNLGVIYLNLGDKKSARTELDKLKPLDQRLAKKLSDLIEGKAPAGN